MFKGIGVATDDAHEIFGFDLEQDVGHSSIVIVVNVCFLDTSVDYVADEAEHDVVISEEAALTDTIEVIIVFIEQIDHSFL